ncbi:hypothetical protein U1Q18_003608, partial [Sarracenia purpurea var. burkii]
SKKNKKKEKGVNNCEKSLQKTYSEEFRDKRLPVSFGGKPLGGERRHLVYDTKERGKGVALGPGDSGKGVVKGTGNRPVFKVGSVGHKGVATIAVGRESIEAGSVGQRRSGRARAGTAGRTTIFIENLPVEMHQQWLRDIFRKCGRVISIFIPMRRRARTRTCFGFVNFLSPFVAARAAARYDGVWCRDRRLKVNRARFDHPMMSYVWKSGQVKQGVKRYESNRGEGRTRQGFEIDKTFNEMNLEPK